MLDRTPRAFFVLSVVVLGLLVAAIWQAASPSWKQYQAAFRHIEAQQEPNAAAKDAVLATPPAIKQILLPGLHRVDRCTTCHLGVEDPTLKNAAEPFRYHPNLRPHSAARFGCTICHGGQGLATTKQAAHGDVEFWSQPLLPKQYIRASCGRCHKEGDIPGVPELAEGRQIFESHGCRGCHKLNGVGGSVGPDLTEEGASNRSPEWLERHFLDPKTVSPSTAMPNMRFTREQARSLTFYMLSLTSEQMATYYSSVRVIPGATVGRALFVEKNCIACHNIGGAGSTQGPDLLGVTKRHSPGWLDEQLVNPQFIMPGSIMPAYDLEPNARKAIVTYLASATPEDAKLILASRSKPLSSDEASIEGGKAIFVRSGCVGCHGIGAVGGVPNPNSQGGEVPSLKHVSDDYTKPEVMAIIRKGKMAPVADQKKASPPLYMPAWGAVLSDEDISRIVDYLWSLQPKQKDDAW